MFYICKKHNTIFHSAIPPHFTLLPSWGQHCSIVCPNDSKISWEHVSVLAALLATQLPANGLGRAVEDVWALAIQVGDLDGLPDFWLLALSSAWVNPGHCA